MVTLDFELGSLKESLLEMLELVKEQLVKSKEALEKCDGKLAKEVVKGEKRLNALEIAIDKDCENILALQRPVATDLRFVLSTLKICGDLESIGDIIKGLARFVQKHNKKASLRFSDQFRIGHVIRICIAMLKDMGDAISKEDAVLARKTLKKAAVLSKISKETAKVSSTLIKEHPEKLTLILKLFSISRKFEQVGDLIKNIGEEVVFHVEARVLKHKEEESKKKG
jgi:phosphate transport system protein